MMMKLCCEVVLVPLYKYRGDNTTLPLCGNTTFHNISQVQLEMGYLAMIPRCCLQGMHHKRIQLVSEVLRSQP